MGVCTIRFVLRSITTILPRLKRPVVSHGKVASPDILGMILHKGGPSLA